MPARDGIGSLIRIVLLLEEVVPVSFDGLRDITLLLLEVVMEGQEA